MKAEGPLRDCCLENICSRETGEQRSGSGCTMRAEGTKLPEFLYVVYGEVRRRQDESVVPEVWGSLLRVRWW